MKELAEHLLDILQNCLFAGASRVTINLVEDVATDQLTMEIKDNGCGMDEQLLAKVLDPFVTTRNKKTGLGLPLLAQTAQLCNGSLVLASKVGEGTEVTLKIQQSHWDCPPLGNVIDTITSCLNEQTHLVFMHKCLDSTGSVVGVVSLDTDDIKAHLEGIPMNHPEVLLFVRRMLEQEYEEMEGRER